MSQARSTVMKVSEWAGSHASWIIFAGMKLKEPGPSSARWPSHSRTAVPRMIVWVSLALCQCLRTWIAAGVRIISCVAWVAGSTCMITISGEVAPSSGTILVQVRSRCRRKAGCSEACPGVGPPGCIHALIPQPHAVAARTMAIVRCCTMTMPSSALRRSPLRDEVAVRRRREVDDQGHVQAQLLGRAPDETPDGSHALLARDEHDRVRHTVLPRGQDGRMDDHPRQKPPAPARARPLAREGPAVRAHRAGRMPPAAAVGAALEAELACPRGGPVRDPVLAARAPDERFFRHGSVAPQQQRARRHHVATRHQR